MGETKSAATLSLVTHPISPLPSSTLWETHYIEVCAPVIPDPSWALAIRIPLPPMDDGGSGQRESSLDLLRKGCTSLLSVTITKTANFDSLQHKLLGIEWKKVEKRAVQYIFTYITYQFNKTCALIIRSNGTRHQEQFLPSMDYNIIHSLLKHRQTRLPNFRVKPIDGIRFLSHCRIQPSLSLN